MDRDLYSDISVQCLAPLRCVSLKGFLFSERLIGMVADSHNHYMTDTFFLSVMIGLLTLPVISCTNPVTKASFEKGLSEWKDIPVSDLFAEWGSPQKSYPLEDGGEIIEYIRECEIILPRDDCVPVPRGPFLHHFYNDCEETFPVLSTIVTKTQFFVDPNGIIYSYWWESNP